MEKEREGKKKGRKGRENGEKGKRWKKRREMEKRVQRGREGNFPPPPLLQALERHCTYVLWRDTDLN